MQYIISTDKTRRELLQLEQFNISIQHIRGKIYEIDAEINCVRLPNGAVILNENSVLRLVSKEEATKLFGENNARSY